MGRRRSKKNRTGNAKKKMKIESVLLLTENASLTEKVLQNPVILKHLFGLCSQQLLASCRRVSKLWYKESSPAWRRSVQINIKCPIEEAIKLLNNGLCSLTLHYRKMKLDKLIMSNEEVHNRFQSFIGAHLTSLTLASYKFQTVDEFRQLLYNSCPLLQKLNLLYCRLPKGRKLGTGCEGSSSSSSALSPLSYRKNQNLVFLEISFGVGRLPVCWIELFLQFPNLTIFRIGTILAETEITEILEGIRFLRKIDARILPFVEFQLKTPLVISHDLVIQSKCTLVKTLRLPCTHVAIKLDPELDHSFVWNILDSLASSVKKIEIMHGRQFVQGPSWFKEFPLGITMKKVKILQCFGKHLSSLDFIHYFPQLSSLAILERRNDLLGVNGETTPTLLFAKCSEEDLNKLATLECFKLGYWVTLDQCKQLANSMKKIKELEMALDYEQYKVICSSCTELRKLKIRGDGLTEMEIEGIKESVDMKKIGDCGEGSAPIKNLVFLKEISYPAGRRDQGFQENTISFFVD